MDARSFRKIRILHQQIPKRVGGLIPFLLLLTILGLLWVVVNCIFGGQRSRFPIIRHVYTPGFSVPNPEICKRQRGLDEPDLRLLVIVQSDAKGRLWRKAVRNTWGNVTLTSGIRVAFFFGHTADPAEQDIIFGEYAHYGDVIVARQMDGYEKLTLKTTSMLEWIKDYCPNVPLILKADHDAFINPTKLLQLAKRHRNAKNTVFGNCCHPYQKVHRNDEAKFKMTREDYPDDYYPTFCTGLAYILTQDAVPNLYERALGTIAFPFEDVLMNGIVSEKAGVQRKHIFGFLETVNEQLFTSSPCKLRHGVAYHCRKPDQLHQFWSILGNNQINATCH